MTITRRTTLSRSLGTVLAFAGTSIAANAQSSSNYSVTHTFSYAPAGNVVDVRAMQFEHAWVVSDGVPATDRFPFLQDPSFEPFGTDSFLASGLAENSGFGTPVPALYQVSNILPAGTGGPVNHCTTVIVPPSIAKACTSYDIQPFLIPPGSFQIDGKINSAGSVTADVFGRGAATAYAFSNTAIRVQGGNLMGNGTILWNPNFFFDAVGGGTSATLIQDPIVMEVTNLTTGANSTFDLLHIDAKISGNGFIEWVPTGITVNARSAQITAVIPSGLVGATQSGLLQISIAGSVVTSSTGTGVFAGSAPAVGTTVPFTRPAPALKLDYDLGFNPEMQYQVRATLAGGGSSKVQYVPCAVDLNGDGIADNGDIAMFVNLFLAGDLAVDFTGDGILDNGDIGAFIAAFLAGCP